MIRGIFLLSMVLCSFNFNAALDCVNCIWYASRPDANYRCFEYTDTSSPGAPTRSCSDSSSPPYCQTKYTYKQGIISQISRGCSYGNDDHDDSSTDVPSKDKCDITSIPNSPSIIECYSACKTNSCNTDKPESFSACKLDCGSNGDCNLLTGNCECMDGFSGDRCQTDDRRYRQCVQCNSETDPNCETMNQASDCSLLTHKYCAVTSIRRFDSDGKEINRFLSRTCTASFVGVNSCYTTAADFGDIDYTCTTTCDSDGCNTGMPDDSSNDRLRCVICDSRNGVNSCANATSTDVCPSSATHCTAEVSYFISEDDDIEISNKYQLSNVVRGCSSDAFPKECKEIKVTGTRLKKVTCTESCSEEGCNSGWPARPKCSQCSCSQCTTDSSCYLNPTEPTRCGFPYQKYCVVEELNRGKNDMNGGFVDGYTRSIQRFCSPISLGNQCVKSSYNSNFLQNCNRSCTDDGCNLGNGVAATLMSAHLYLLPLIFLSITTLTF